MAMNFTDTQLNLFEYIAKLPEAKLKTVLAQILKSYGYNPVEREKSIMAEGQIPIALVAHLDTVFPKPPQLFYYDKDKNVMFDPNGLGADDRLGVMGILQLLGSGLRPHVIFTCEEETGGAGAHEVASEQPFEDLRFIIELDRQGFNDCVFYNCDNEKFVKYIESFGFVEEYGTFTDISIICPAWGVAGTNLSIGYIDEHTFVERIAVSAYFSTLSKVNKILKTPINEIPRFEYIPSTASYQWMMKDAACECRECHKKVLYSETLPAIYEDGTHEVCFDCLDNPETIDWCDMCARLYHVTDVTKAFNAAHNINICHKCAKEGSI